MHELDAWVEGGVRTHTSTHTHTYTHTHTHTCTHTHTHTLPAEEHTYTSADRVDKQTMTASTKLHPRY